MLSGVMLIIITMFAVLGAYFLSEVLTDCMFKKGCAPKAVVVLANNSVELVWNSIVELRRKLPNSEIIVLCQAKGENPENLQPPVKGVTFTTLEDIQKSISNIFLIDLQK